MTKYSLRTAVLETANPILGSAGFAFEEHEIVRGVYTFTRKRKDGLFEAVVFGVGKYRHQFGVDLAIVWAGQHPMDALPAMPRLSSRDREIGVRDSLGRVVFDDRDVLGRDVYEWATDEELREKVAELAKLALRHGPSYWDWQSERLKKPRMLGTRRIRRKEPRP